MKRIDGFAAHAAHNPMMQQFELWLWHEGMHGDVHGSWHRRVIDVTPRRPPLIGDEFVPDAGLNPPPMWVPEQYAEPLRDALDQALGRPQDDYRARYEEAQAALAIERGRVDALLMNVHSRLS